MLKCLSETFGEKEDKVGTRQRRKDAEKASLINVGADQMENVQHTVQLDQDVGVGKEEEKRLDADEPEGYAKTATISIQTQETNVNAIMTYVGIGAQDSGMPKDE